MPVLKKPLVDSEEGYEEEINPNEVGISAAGFYPQNSSSSNMNVGVERDSSGNLVLKDSISGSYTLNSLASGGISEQILRLNDAAENMPTGAYREITGSPFPSAVIWWTNNSKTHKILSIDYTRTGVFPTLIVSKVYDTDGSTVLHTITDNISYSGAFETHRTRTIS